MTGSLHIDTVGLASVVLDRFGPDYQALTRVLGVSALAFSEFAVAFDEQTGGARLTQFYPEKPVRILPGTLRNWVDNEF